jgi:trans-aconitate 2-methyltransferase
MTRDTCNPNQYERFRAERSQPFDNLLALVQPRPGMRVVDLGCGTGELTADMHRRLQARETLGIDSSESMLAKANAFTNGAVRFRAGDIGPFATCGEYDLAFSDAALQWVPVPDEMLQRWTSASCFGVVAAPAWRCRRCVVRVAAAARCALSGDINRGA